MSYQDFFFDDSPIDGDLIAGFEEDMEYSPFDLLRAEELVGLGAIISLQKFAGKKIGDRVLISLYVFNLKIE